MYIYNNSTWIALGEVVRLLKKNLTVSKGKSLIAIDDGIKATNTGVFIPDLSVDDLASDISVVCEAGKATITLTSNYDIIGDLIIS